MINRQKINRMVEYMKFAGFKFEMIEVIDNLDEILSSYKMLEIELNEDETLLLMAELLPLAEQFEFSESEYLAGQEEPLIMAMEEKKKTAEEKERAGQESGIPAHGSMPVLAVAQAAV